MTVSAPVTAAEAAAAAAAAAKGYLESADDGSSTAASVAGPAGASSKRCPGPRCLLVVKKGCSFGLCSRCCRRLSREPRDGAEQKDCRIHSRSRGAKQQQQQQASPSHSRPSPSGEEASGGAGAGKGSSAPRLQEYASRCRVLLVGIGADEQMGGYGRHRTVFRKGQPGALPSRLVPSSSRRLTLCLCVCMCMFVRVQERTGRLQPWAARRRSRGSWRKTCRACGSAISAGARLTLKLLIMSPLK
jgi:hypothetical protein